MPIRPQPLAAANGTSSVGVAPNTVSWSSDSGCLLAARSSNCGELTKASMHRERRPAVDTHHLRQWLIAVQAQIWQAIKHRVDCARHFHSGQVLAETDMRTRGKCKVPVT